ncbi:Down syndrome cell adhesion molecule [Araneus ventricosus]|uniref:Down syndrome cell adhesion molecule n=1 Tax=Araneus ventricosus TaxID=182803 RepID=A0A4Y2ICF8_ARAVE|nr:Down syndrome cell adhesion molecule [Araneus ventricosus]
MLIGFYTILLSFSVLSFGVDSYNRKRSLGYPRIQPFNFPEKLTEGQKTKILCTVIDGTGPFKFLWYKNDHALTTSSSVTIQNSEEYSMLLFNSLSTDHGGNYSCVVTNSFGRDSYSSQLVINEERNKESFEEERIKTYSNGTLIISSVKKSDEGIYKCTISNNIGQDLHKLVSLTVIVPARFEEKFTMKNVRRGETATLKCEAVGDKPLSITWTKDKAEIDFKKHTRLEKFDRDIEKGLSSELIIRTTDRKDGALYGCLAKNEYGSDERNIKLLVVEVPAQPLDVKVKEAWSRTASITWSAPYSGNSPITKYIIQYWRDRGGPHRLLEDIIPNSQTQVLLKNLQPGTPYAVTVLGENEIGQGQPSDVLKFVTGEEEPNGPPTDVWVEAKSSNSILVTWKPPPRELWNGELRGYFVGYKVDGSSHPYSFKTVDNAVNDSHEYALTNLMKSTKYNIVVKAYNSAGTGPPSQDLIAKTLDGGK